MKRIRGNCVLCGRGPKFYENIEIENKALKKMIRKVLADETGAVIMHFLKKHSGLLPAHVEKQVFGKARA